MSANLARLIPFPNLESGFDERLDASQPLLGGQLEEGADLGAIHTVAVYLGPSRFLPGACGASHEPSLPLSRRGAPQGRLRAETAHATSLVCPR